MDFFLSHADCYFTPRTAAKTLELSYDSVKNCMSLLLKNSYLTKEDGPGTNHYNITKENMQFWAVDYKARVLTEYENGGKNESS